VASAFVVPRAGCAVDEVAHIDFCREGIESYKRPRKVVFLDALPTTATGKIRRVELRAAAATLLLEPVVATGD
jgi:benzoate-CoA ligase